MANDTMSRSKDMQGAARRAEFKRRFRKAAETERGAMTMAQVRIRQAVARKPWPRWHLLKFLGRGGGDARGVVDLLAIRKDHRKVWAGMKRGDAFQIVLIQVKGGYAARPTHGDAERLRSVARRHRANTVLLATWKKGAAARFFVLRRSLGAENWRELDNLESIFA